MVFYPSRSIMPVARVKSILFDRSDSAEPITAQELADRLDCGILVAHRHLTELEKLGVVKSKRVGNNGLVWWVPERIVRHGTHQSIRYIQSQERDTRKEEQYLKDSVEEFCDEVGLEHLVKRSIQILEDFVSSEELMNAEQWDQERWIAAAVRLASEEDGTEITYSKLSEHTKRSSDSQINTRAHSMSIQLSE